MTDTLNAGGFDDRSDEYAFLCKAAARDAELAALRAVWEATPVGQREPLRAALRALHEVQKLVGNLSGYGLRARPLLTHRELAEGVAAHDQGGERAAMYDALAELPADVEVSPAELLCAIECWQRGEAYLPHLLPAAHPDWPDLTERAFTLAGLRDAGVDPGPPEED